MLKTYDYTCDKCGRTCECIVNADERDAGRPCETFVGGSVCNGVLRRDEISRGRGLLKPDGGYKFGLVRENGERITLHKGRTE